ncbi:MAG: right-handed parallel beta-helix repeat-containing protein [Ignavibacteriales bacterium]|nr:MAG: right-handed parallel beta-helix repeat-containing protein [Ignavibacteriales bacterium]
MKNLFTVFIVTILFISFTDAQTKYYVSTTGSNSNNGLTSSTAFATLQYAADQVEAGDSVFVLIGTYVGFDIRTDGSQSNRITFKAESENVIINERNTTTPDGINIENGSWIVIDGFTVIDQPRAGIRIVLSDNVTIKNNVCADNYRWGIFSGFADDLRIENNSCSNSEDEHGIYVSNSGDRPVIINNHSFNNNGCGIHMNGDISMGDDGIISDAVVAGNIIHGNGLGGGSAINMDGVQDSKVFNNIIYNNFATGIAMYQIDGGEPSKNNKIFNNTVIMPTNGRWGVLVVNGSTGNTLYNNILINYHSFRGSICMDNESKTGFTSDYNILVNRLSDDDGSSNMSLTSWQSMGYDMNSQISVAENLIFANPTGNDYHLLQNSQATNTGTSLVNSVVLTDKDGVTRPQGSGYDIGAYEFQSPTGIDEENIANDFTLEQNYPNPFNPSTKIKFTIPSNVNGETANVKLTVFDVLGNKIVTLVNEEKPAGVYEVIFDANELSSGIYFYKLTAGNFTSVKKMMLLR